MKILVINCGSSSIKYRFFDMENEEELARGIVEKIGEDHSFFSQETKKGKTEKEVLVSNNRQGPQLIICCQPRPKDSKKANLPIMVSSSILRYHVERGKFDCWNWSSLG